MIHYGTKERYGQLEFNFQMWGFFPERKKVQNPTKQCGILDH